MAGATTPKRPAPGFSFPSPTIGPLAKRTVTPEPKKQVLPPSAKTAPPLGRVKDAAELFAKAPSSTVKVTGVSPPVASAANGWSQTGGEIVVVQARMHGDKLHKRGFSWLHQFEHARFLHAGLPPGEVSWPTYPDKPVAGIERDTLREQHAYLSAISPFRIQLPEESLWLEFPRCEANEEMAAAFMKGTIHFTGGLSIVKDPAKKADSLVFKLNAPIAGMGCALYRRYGSDRFFRIALDDEVTRRAAPSLDSDRSSQREEALREQVATFFEHPLLVFGRLYRPFCWKDGAAVYWCESGPGLETVPLTAFAENYLETSLNPGMSVAKYAARFELGLTTTTPTTHFPSSHVFRTPDLNSDSLKISFAAMQAVCALFRELHPDFAADCLPPWYTPSCIRALVSQPFSNASYPVIYQLDYSTSSLESTSAFIEAYPFPTGPSRAASPVFEFEVEAKDGRRERVRGPKGMDVRWVAEKKLKSGEEEVVMTDGCSLMSFAAMKELMEHVAASRGTPELKLDVPAVAQGRIGGGKGVWVRAPPFPSNGDKAWIEVRDRRARFSSPLRPFVPDLASSCARSQWKFKMSEMQTKGGLTFELHSIPSGKGSAKLGKQTFEVLSHCGVPTSAFRELLRKQIETGLDSFFNPDSLPALLYHVEKTSGVMEDRTAKARAARDPSNLRPLDGFAAAGEEDAVTTESGEFVHDRRLDPASGAPNTVAEVVCEMLQSGFDPTENPHLADKIHLVAKAWIQKQISWKIDDEYSRTAFVIADHLGVLKEGEFFFQSSDPLPSPNGQGTVNVVLGPALLSRAPAIQPCDVQKWTGVFCPEYHTYRDVVIVSAKGERAACSILSGGDYDGDKLVVCTNPALVTPFQPSRASPHFADPPFADSDWFDVDQRRVKDVIAPAVASGDSGALARVFMEGLHQGTQFGVVNTWWTTLAYSLGLDHALTSEAGHLFCRALDGRKQGLRFTPSSWAVAKEKFFLPHKCRPKWTYCEDGKKPPGNEKFASRGKGLGRHAMDELILEGEAAKRTAAAQFANWCEARAPSGVDPDLAEEWLTAWREAGEDARAGNAGAREYFEDLQGILDHVRTSYAQYKELRSRWSREKDSRLAADNASNAHGSPTKSPSKRSKGTEWSASSRSQKEELLDLTRRFWAVLEQGRMKSLRLCGREGARSVRALVFQAVSPAKPLSSSARGSTSTVPASPSVTTVLSTTSSSTTIVVTAPPPAEKDADGDDVFHDAEDSLELGEFGEEFKWSQTGGSGSQIAAGSSTVFTSSTASSSVASSQTLAPSGPPSVLASPSRPAPSQPQPVARRRSFLEATRSGATRFCYDMAHRDVLALKADAITRRVHGTGEAQRGVQARKVAPDMLDVLAVSKRCAGITKARAKVRPRTLLDSKTTAETSETVAAGASPAKRARRT
ncbi:hypothetical protein JCM10213v2_005079 [Rhodosporidiobolus nylandii]